MAGNALGRRAWVTIRPAAGTVAVAPARSRAGAGSCHGRGTHSLSRAPGTDSTRCDPSGAYARCHRAAQLCDQRRSAEDVLVRQTVQGTAGATRARVDPTAHRGAAHESATLGLVVFDRSLTAQRPSAWHVPAHVKPKKNKHCAADAGARPAGRRSAGVQQSARADAKMAPRLCA